MTTFLKEFLTTLQQEETAFLMKLESVEYWHGETEDNREMLLLCLYFNNKLHFWLSVELKASQTDLSKSYVVLFKLMALNKVYEIRGSQGS